MPSGEAREESELLLEEVAISETTNLESALENLKIQVGRAPLNIACCHQSASASAKLSSEFSRIGSIRQSGQLNTCVTCPPPSPPFRDASPSQPSPIRRNFHQIEDVWSGFCGRVSFPLP